MECDVIQASIYFTNSTLELVMSLLDLKNNYASFFYEDNHSVIQVVTLRNPKQIQMYAFMITLV